MWTSGNYILRTVQWDFRPPVFFIIWTSMGHCLNKIFSILVQISLSYLNFYESPWGIILWGVNLPGVSYCAKSISPGYHTPGVNRKSTKTWLTGVYDSPVSQCKKLSIRSSKYNTCFTCIIFLAGTVPADFNSFSKSCLTSSKLEQF